MEKTTVYEIVNKAIIEQLEKGVVPWKMPWATQLPMNLVSKAEYKGFNWWVLMLEQNVRGYNSNVWATFKQINERGGKVKKGEKSIPIIYWTLLETKVETKDGEVQAGRKVPLLRYYHVFNLNQTEGIEVKQEEYNSTFIDEGDTIITKYAEQIDIKYGGSRAYYSPVKDYIQVPDKDVYKTTEGYYNTVFHEMIHSTGHKKRLNRFEEDNNVEVSFGSQSYAKEELVAELGACYLCTRIGLQADAVQQSASYIQSWLKALRDDKTLLVSASGKAQKAVDFITGSNE